MIELVAVIVGGVLAIAGGIIGNYIFFKSQKDFERDSLKGSFAGEISALISIVKKRKYIENLDQLIKTMQKKQVKLPFYFQVTYNYFNVYEKNVDKIGLLMSPLPELIAKFYTQCFSILEDIKLIEKINIDEIDLEQLIGHYNELLSLFTDTLETGESVIRIVKK